MPRKQRIDFPGDVYGMICCGNYRKKLKTVQWETLVTQEIQRQKINDPRFRAARKRRVESQNCNFITQGDDCK
tara:strand:- start:12956 stop:13174 length:219 start_codon:yes stop_codon:yes gene_type:complete